MLKYVITPSNGTFAWTRTSTLSVSEDRSVKDGVPDTVAPEAGAKGDDDKHLPLDPPEEPGD